ATFIFIQQVIHIISALARYRLKEQAGLFPVDRSYFGVQHPLSGFSIYYHYPFFSDTGIRPSPDNQSVGKLPASVKLQHCPVTSQLVGVPALFTATIG